MESGAATKAKLQAQKIEIISPQMVEMRIQLVGVTSLLVARRHERVCPDDDEGILKARQAGNALDLLAPAKPLKKQPKGKKEQPAKAVKPSRTNAIDKLARLLTQEEMYDLFQHRFGPKNQYHGFPAVAVKAAMLNVTNALKAVKKIDLWAKQISFMFHVFPDTDGHNDLMRLEFSGSEPERYHRVCVIPKANVPHPVTRPLYHDWRAKIRIRFDENLMSANSVLNLLVHAGSWGLGALRPECGGTFGLFGIEAAKKRS